MKYLLNSYFHAIKKEPLANRRLSDTERKVLQDLQRLISTKVYEAEQELGGRVQVFKWQGEYVVSFSPHLQPEMKMLSQAKPNE